MSKLIVEGKDLLLEALGHNYRYKVVQLSKADKEVLQRAIEVLDHAADLWAVANVNNDAYGNPYRQAELEIREALDY